VLLPLGRLVVHDRRPLVQPFAGAFGVLLGETP
jgi:hypothetical protein